MIFCADQAKICEWVCEKAGGVYTHICTGVGVEDEKGVLQAGVMYNGFTGESGSIHMHSRIDNPKYATRAFYYFAFAYPFLQLGVKVCYGIVSTENYKAIKLNTKLGFKKEFPLRNYFPDGDAILFSLHKDDCRWIRKKHVEKLDFRIAA